MDESADAWEKVKMNVRAVVESAQGGLPLNWLETDYMDAIHRRVPYALYGFDSVQEMIGAMGDVVAMVPKDLATEEVGTDFGATNNISCDTVLIPVNSDDTRHVAAMVRGQKNVAITRFGKKVRGMEDRDREKDRHRNANPSSEDEELLCALRSEVKQENPPIQTIIINPKTHAPLSARTSPQNTPPRTANFPSCSGFSSPGFGEPMQRSVRKTVAAPRPVIAAASAAVETNRALDFVGRSMNETLVVQQDGPFIDFDSDPIPTGNLIDLDFESPVSIAPVLEPSRQSAQISPGNVTTADLIEFSDPSQAGSPTPDNDASLLDLLPPQIVAINDDELLQLERDILHLEEPPICPVLPRDEPAPWSLVSLLLEAECNSRGVRLSVLETCIDNCREEYNLWRDLDPIEYKVQYIVDSIQTAQTINSTPSRKHTWCRFFDGLMSEDWDDLVEKDNGNEDTIDMVESRDKCMFLLRQRLAEMGFSPSAAQLSPTSQYYDHSDDVNNSFESNSSSSSGERNRPNADFVRRALEANRRTNDRVEKERLDACDLLLEEKGVELGKEIQTLIHLIFVFTAKVNNGIILSDLPLMHELQHDGEGLETPLTEETFEFLIEEVTRRDDVFDIEVAENVGESRVRRKAQ